MTHHSDFLYDLACLGTDCMFTRCYGDSKGSLLLMLYVKLTTLLLLDKFYFVCCTSTSIKAAYVRTSALYLPLSARPLTLLRALPSTRGFQSWFSTCTRCVHVRVLDCNCGANVCAVRIVSQTEGRRVKFCVGKNSCSSQTTKKESESTLLRATD